MSFSKFATLNRELVQKELSTNATTGLASEQVHHLLETVGPNEVKESQTTWWQILINQFKSSFIYLLVFASMLAFALGEKIDAALILLFILINSILGFIQEFRSETTVKSLKKFTQGRARVRRDGVERTIPNAELVPGDIVILETGDIAPADLRLLSVHNFLVDESVLTGESLQISKTDRAMDNPPSQPFEALNMMFKGTSVLNGKAEGVVTSTGKDTEIGKISRIITETKKESAFQQNINQISKFIIWLVVATLFLVIGFHAFFRPGGGTSFTDLIIFAIAMTVGVIPEALPLVTTFSLSSGAKKLAEKSVVVKRLTSIEDLGSIQVLCTDKTGTITQNKLTVAEVKTVQEGADPVFTGALAISNIYEEQDLPNNAFDLSLLAKLGAERKKELASFTLLNEIPFDPTRRRNSVMVEKNGMRNLIVRGSPEEMVALDSHLTLKEKESALDWLLVQGAIGRRTLAVSLQEWKGSKEYNAQDEVTHIRIIGLVSFVDELKPSTKAVVEKARSLGVRLVVLTGDDPVVAGAVGQEAGILQNREDVMSGSAYEALSDAEKDEAVRDISVFARVSPKQKFEIIQKLQESFLVGFLGEGINDAPALKGANVSLVVESASDIARETADIVLLKHDLGVIVDGIIEGRKTFANTVTYIRATLLSNFGNFFAVAFASMIIPYLPMLPVQILLLNLLSDFPMFSISTDNVSDKDLGNPKTYNTRDILIIAVFLGIVSTLFDFIIFGTFQRFGEKFLQTNWFIGSVATELALLYSIRTNKLFFKANVPPSKPIILLSVGALAAAFGLPFTHIGRTWFHFTQPKPEHLVLLAIVVLLYFATTEFVKFLYYRFLEQD